ncbi:Serine/threonine-protein kinase [Lachnellula subtilissima]|uniref:EKC/KEOPS complex subunit BUD32 n=1 Tax=Lachnellula subtilissima TaxID=602034 RepID=A0A8H8U6T2_9HELO|nr:Serine/threonine-protein kinase [Lachnellula subtilissima]
MDGRQKYERNGLSIAGAPFGLEKIRDYLPGGHHPIHLGHLIKDSRYRVIHKLGSGGYANVWLCRDMLSQDVAKYVALKILMSHVSTDNCLQLRMSKKLENLLSEKNGDTGAKYICQTKDQFPMDGPNGSHICFVYSILGARVSSSVSNSFTDPDGTLKNVCLKSAEAMDFLHSHGICHGDFTPHNILFHIARFDGLNENGIIRILGEPVKTEVRTESGETPTLPTAPKYLVYQIAWSSVNPEYLSSEPCIVDFGESFGVFNPPEDSGIPGPYRSPELMFDKAVGYSSDIWALGCTLFEIRTGRNLFSPFNDDQEDYLIEMVQMLGPLPEPWWSVSWENRKKWFADEADSEGRVVATWEPAALEPEEPQMEYTNSVHPSVVQEARSIQEKLAPGVWYLDPRDVHRDISKEEIEIFADLVGKILRFDPKERLSARGVQDHEWFRG